VASGAKRPRADDDEDGSRMDERKIQANHPKRRLPLASHKRDDRAWV
jgi:hypothetical protein